MEFSKLAELCEKLEKTRKRNVMIETVARFISGLEKSEVRPVCDMLLGKSASASELGKGLGWESIKKVVLKVTGLKESEFWKFFKETGDLGETTKIAFEKRKIAHVSLHPRQLTVEEVWAILHKISEISGKGANERKEKLLEGLLNRCGPTEAKLLVKILTGEMRTGFKGEMLKNSLAKAFGISEEEIERAVGVMADISEVAARIAEKGKDAISSLQISTFQPVEPMLAQIAKDVQEALSLHGGQTSFEFKLDGARIQLHKKGSIVKVFSRSLKDVSVCLPEIVEKVQEIKAEEAILDGEVIAVDQHGNPLPFQYLLRRFRREMEVPKIVKGIFLKLQLFDVLYVDGQVTTNLPYLQRREKLLNLIPPDCIVPAMITSSKKEAEEFLNEAIKQGHEGLVAKALHGKYLLGSRSELWLKIKPVLEPLDLVIVGAEWGHGRRARYLSDYYLGALDEKTGKFEIVGKTFKGLSDKELEQMTKRLIDLKISEEGRTVWVKPEIVVEVFYNEIQKSPKYPCGMALRFARINRIREEKTAEQADTLQKLRKIFESQRKIY
ncbi:MAG: ATP-dependent DNA ligase [Candidatus Hadarchaeales archaeon]